MILTVCMTVPSTSRWSRGWCEQCGQGTPEQSRHDAAQMATETTDRAAITPAAFAAVLAVVHSTEDCSVSHHTGGSMVRWGSNLKEEFGTVTWMSSNSAQAAYLVGSRKPPTLENVGESALRTIFMANSTAEKPTCGSRTSGFENAGHHTECQTERTTDSYRGSQQRQRSTIRCITYCTLLKQAGVPENVRGEERACDDKDVRGNQQECDHNDESLRAHSLL
jgi:hypothetical protein